MQVAFWSNIGGKNCVTGNLASISIMSVLKHPKKVILFENHSQINNLEVALSGRTNLFREELPYGYSHIGMDAFMKKLHAGIADTTSLEQVSLKFFGGQVYYIPQTKFQNPEVFEYELNQVISMMMEKLGQFSGNVFIDTAGEDNLTSKIILQQADIVVVNLCQDPHIVHHFFENYESLIPKSVFLLGSYNPESKFDISRIRRTYRIERDKIAEIPYNVEYKDAFISGNVISFLIKNYPCKKDNNNYYFIQKLKKATQMLWKEMEKKSKEIAVIE